MSGTRKICLIGYAGGVIATEWAAELAPAYAPQVNPRIVGAAFGGTLVDPAHNLRHVGGSTTWAGVIPMALIGDARVRRATPWPRFLEAGGPLRLRFVCHAHRRPFFGDLPGAVAFQAGKFSWGFFWRDRCFDGFGFFWFGLLLGRRDSGGRWGSRSRRAGRRLGRGLRSWGRPPLARFLRARCAAGMMDDALVMSAATGVAMLSSAGLCRQCEHGEDGPDGSYAPHDSQPV